jgi:PAS domain S-box-containing protein
LLALVAITFVPIFMLVVRLTQDERRATYLRERESSLRLLDVALTEHRDLTRGGRELLRHLAAIPEVATGSPEACTRQLQELLAPYANYTAATRITRDLRMDCSDVPFPDSLANVSRAPSMARVARTGEGVGSWLRVGRDGMPLATIIEPVRNSAGEVRFYLAVEAELHWFSHLARSIPQVPGAIAALVDTTGFILARMPDGEQFAGARHVVNPTLRSMIGRDSGFVHGTGLDGRERLYAFRVVPSDNDGHVLLMVGLPTNVVYADANKHLRSNILLTATILFLTLLMAWIAADLFVIRDVRALLGATGRLADGDLSSRAPPVMSGGELNELASRFNDMARRLEERRREFVVLGDSSSDAIVRVTRDLEIEWANAALLNRIGASTEDITGCPIEDIPLEPALASAVAEQIREVLATGRRRESEQFVTTPSGDLWIDLRVTPERNAAGDLTHVMVIARDVTARRQLAAHLAQAERLDSIGKLAGHVAHDFNNLLTAIIGNAEIAIRHLEPTDRARADVEKVLDVSRRASSLTRQLLSFARRQSTSSRVIDVRRFIEDAAPLLRRVVGDQVQLGLELDPTTPNVRFDPTQLEQVLVNLAANARDAMPGGGTLIISARLDTVFGPDTAPDGRRPGDYLSLVVSDTGLGMSAEVKQRIFEPFFSTKHALGGTGLGLPVVYGAIRQHGGIIEVESAEGQGATVRIFIPATDAAIERVEQGTRPAEAPRGRETILLAEDQDDVRSTISRLLRAHGYAVIAAEDGAEVLSRIERGDMPAFHLVITDLVMPRVGGEALVTALRPTFRTVPVLVISGFDAQGSLKRMFERGDASAFLEKPFEGQQLLKVVRELLDSELPLNPTDQGNAISSALR